MSTGKTISFLEVSSARTLRREVQNICESYSHPWDVLAELCQNAVDAIMLHQRRFGESAPKLHKIDITLNARERSVFIKDSGVGFAPDHFSEMLAPHGTDKPGGPDTIGEKGVGLTYTIFSCNKYEITTHSTSARIAGLIDGAAQWKNGAREELPQFQVTEWTKAEFSPMETFTEIRLHDVERLYPEDEDIFYQRLEVITFFLRTKTAVGSVKRVFGGSGLGLEVNLNFINLEGETRALSLLPEFMLPEESFRSRQVLNLDDFKETAATMDDAQKARRLQGKAIIKKGAFERAGRRINYYVFFAPSRTLWREISEREGIFSVNESGERTYLYQPGIYITSKGMPTGITLEPPVTGSMGYWPNFFIILEDNQIVFDLGRKSIPGRTKRLLREIARDLFVEIRPFFEYATSDPAVTTRGSATVQQYQKTQVFKDLGTLADLGLPTINYLKHPYGQEAAVVALFHELVAAGLLRGYYTLRTGYRETYDLWGLYRASHDLIGETHKRLVQKGGHLDLPNSDRVQVFRR